ncbi:recombinase family protein [Streptomyces rochei]|uniref:recombinase family protein n=1 Tax=Streptomyces rochei TaxID=1928 RepID=UPI0022E9B88A|nr:recombinase family protein [Streptomyces rochei]MCC8455592.1 recombinase family protein [Streptomyces rochei]
MSRAESTTPTERTGRPDTGAAVLYVCAERGRLVPTLAADRAQSEGRAYATAHGYRLTDVITDPYGEADPVRRAGWRLVRALAQAGTISTVIVRWPAAIAPDGAADLRHREIRWLQDHGVQVRYSWAPLAAGGDPR